MRLLCCNLLQDASLSSVYADDTTDVSNLLDRLLTLKYLSSQTSDTITGMWASDQTIKCIALGFHNLTSATYILKDSTDTTIGSGSLDVNYDTDMTYFTEVTGVRSIEVTINADDVCYLGGLSCGSTFDVDYINVNPRFDYVNGDEADWLAGGQTTGTRTVQTERWRATVSDLTNDQRLAFKEILSSVGGWFPIYADLYEDSHSEQRAIHGILQGNNQFTRESTARVYSTTMVVREAR